MNLDEFIHEERVGYFSMEIALRSEIPTYAGGLGVLAGDTLRSAADLELPMVGITLLSRVGYFKQTIDAQGRQQEAPCSWEPERWATPLGAKVALEIGGATVWVSGWLYVLEGHMSGRQPVIMLDTDLAENSPGDQRLTDVLYGGDTAYRLKQEVVLGMGGTRLLQALGFNIRHYHMNEGHSAFLALELLRRFAYPPEDLRPGDIPYDVPRARDLCSFTTHTPIEAGHDHFDYGQVRELLGDPIEPGLLHQLAGNDRLNMTRLALNMSEYVNGVARRHAEVSRQMFPGYQVHAVTNGVHPFTWTSEPFRKLYDEHVPGWCHEPELLVRADCNIADSDIEQAHHVAKTTLLEHVHQLTGRTLDPDRLLLGFARRMTAYKRPDLLFSDIQRLRAIAKRYPFQLIVSGKAHPHDEGGKRLIEELHNWSRELGDDLPIVFLPDYDMALAQLLVAGVDVWLNTPLRPLEASGTSGMKAAFNGVPNLSVLDGWWIEGCIEGITGWAVGDSSPDGNDGDAESLYGKLEQQVLPLYYENRPGWIAVMKGAISKNASYFNSHRMMRRYATEAYNN